MRRTEATAKHQGPASRSSAVLLKARQSVRFPPHDRPPTGTIEGPWLYARVDAVEIDGQLVLMDLELTEPSLFFDLAPEAVERMAAAIEKRWARAAA